MKVREPKAVLAGIDTTPMIVTRHTTFEGAGLMKFNLNNIFETVKVALQPSGNVGISYDESKNRLLKSTPLFRSDRTIAA